VFLRLACNLVFGVWLLYWAVTFTDWGEGVLSLLALGGVMSWVAVVARVLPKTRQEQLQTLLADCLIESRRAWCVIGVLAALTAATFCVGVVEVANVQGGDALVSVHRFTPAPDAPDGPKDENAPKVPPEPPERVPVGARSRTTFLMWPWARESVRVKVQRLPARELDLRPWWRVARETGKLAPLPLQVPGSFLRPVVVVTGGGPAQRNAGSYQFEIYVNDQQKYRAPFNHRAVLLGTADPDVTVPDRLRAVEGWREVLAQYGDRVLPPHRLAVELGEGDRVRAALVGSGGRLENALVLGTVWEPADMVQGLLVVTSKEK
jgi:hypothetical protein